MSLANCKFLFLDGSYVTSKIVPGDYDAAWNTKGVNFNALDPVFFETDYPRVSQKNKYLGDYLPNDDFEEVGSAGILDFFQKIRNSHLKKGILQIDLQTDLIVRSERQ